jgi:hypothetical protein
MKTEAVEGGVEVKSSRGTEFSLAVGHDRSGYFVRSCGWHAD